MVDESLQSLDAVLAGLHSLADTAETVQDEQVRLRLTGTIVGLRAVILNVRDQILQLHDQNERRAVQMRRQGDDPLLVPPQRTLRKKWGCYQFEDSEGLFCAACYDNKGRRVRATRVNAESLVCPNCRSVYPRR